jgi:DNA-binding MarR family transcriptional regulator
MYMHYVSRMTEQTDDIRWSDVTDEATRTCLLSRTRRVARVVTGIYDEELRPHGLSAPQFSLLVVISRLDGATRSEIGRANSQERSTLSRNLQILLDNGWVTETAAGGRKKSIVMSPEGFALLDRAAPAWRAGQVKTKALLGLDGVASIMNVAEGIAGQ